MTGFKTDDEYVIRLYSLLGSTDIKVNTGAEIFRLDGHSLDLVRHASKEGCLVLRLPSGDYEALRRIVEAINVGLAKKLKTSDRLRDESVDAI
jgi:hypothetical protein